MMGLTHLEVFKNINNSGFPHCPSLCYPQVGCGAGNTIFPLLEINPDLIVYACDFAPSAIQIVKAHPAYSSGRCVPLLFTS